MNIMILAAGLGTRLLPFTEKLPKPLFPVLDKTLLELAINTAKKASPNKLIINTHHLAGMVADYIENHDFGIEIVLSHEETLLGTGGALKAVEKYLQDKMFAVMNSDILIEVNWDNLKKAHKDKNAPATLLLRPNVENGPYSDVTVDNEQRITSITQADEKGAERLMFTGVAMLSPELLTRLAPGRPVDIVKELYLPMIQGNDRLYGHIDDIVWRDAGTIETYHSTVMNALEQYPQPVSMHPNVVPPVYIGPGCVIDESATVGPYAAVHNGAVIGAGSKVIRSIVLPNSIIGEGSVISDAIV